MNKKHVGILSILFASIMWAIEPIFAKLANTDFIQTSAIRAIFAALVGLIYVIFSNRASIKINKSQFSTLLYIAIVGTIFADLVYFFALMQINTPVVNAVIIGHMQPIFIIIISFAILKGDRLNKFDYTGIVFMMLSGLLVTTKTFENLTSFKIGTFGDLLILSATIAWATTAIAMRKYLKDTNAGTITFYRFLLASIFFVIYLALNSNTIF